MQPRQLPATRAAPIDKQLLDKIMRWAPTMRYLEDVVLWKTPSRLPYVALCLVASAVLLPLYVAKPPLIASVAFSIVVFNVLRAANLLSARLFSARRRPQQAGWRIPRVFSRAGPTAATATSTTATSTTTTTTTATAISARSTNELRRRRAGSASKAPSGVPSASGAVAVGVRPAQTVGGQESTLIPRWVGMILLAQQIVSHLLAALLLQRRKTPFSFTLHMTIVCFLFAAVGGLADGITLLVLASYAALLVPVALHSKRINALSARFLESAGSPVQRLDPLVARLSGTSLSQYLASLRAYFFGPSGRSLLAVLLAAAATAPPPSRHSLPRPQQQQRVAVAPVAPKASARLPPVATVTSRPPSASTATANAVVNAATPALAASSGSAGLLARRKGPTLANGQQSAAATTSASTTTNKFGIAKLNVFKKQQ